MHDSDQRSRCPIQHKRLVQDSRIGAEILYPHFVAQHKDWRRSRLVIRRLHHSPRERWHPQKLKRPRRHDAPFVSLRSFSRPVQHIGLVIRDHPIKYVILLHIIQKLCPRVPSPSPGLAPFRVMDLHRIEPLRIRVGERLHHDVIDHAENCGGRPNPQRQRKYRDRRKSRRLPQVPQGIPDILPQRSHAHPPVRSTPLPSIPNSATSSPVTRNGRSSDPFFPLFQLRTPSQLSSTPSTPKSRQSLLCSQISLMSHDQSALLPMFFQAIKQLFSNGPAMRGSNR